MTEERKTELLLKWARGNGWTVANFTEVWEAWATAENTVRAFDWIVEHVKNNGSIGYAPQLNQWFLYANDKNLATGATLLEAIEKRIDDI